ncbi:MAG: hypothetical protein A4E71_02929 [Smithella sp. PtaU1.Bin162]|nr:MAG: hypothetical protein A4E71_02929 [Smithella sp. PtaU1.Bin162]
MSDETGHDIKGKFYMTWYDRMFKENASLRAQLAEAKQCKDIAIRQGLEIKSLEAELSEKDKEIAERFGQACVVAKELREKIRKDGDEWEKLAQRLLERAEKAEAENAELQTAYNDYVDRNNRLIEGNLELKKENAELRERLRDVLNYQKEYNEATHGCKFPGNEYWSGKGMEIVEAIQKAVKYE